MNIEFHPRAQEEFTEESLYYERQIPGLGTQFISELESALALLEAHPKLGAELEDHFRRLPMSRFPHSLIYTVESNVFWIVAVAHQKRRPGYWRDRVDGR